MLRLATLPTYTDAGMRPGLTPSLAHWRRLRIHILLCNKTARSDFSLRTELLQFRHELPLQRDVDWGQKRHTAVLCVLL